MVIGNTVYPKIWQPCDGGVIFAKQHLLRLGIILYGFRLTFAQIADVGVGGIVIDVLTLSSTFLIACFLGQKVFGLDKHTSWLIGAGSSICGAAAVLATEPVVKAEASKVTVAVATVVIFGTIAIFLYPAIYPFWRTGSRRKPTAFIWVRRCMRLLRLSRQATRWVRTRKTRR